MDYKILYETWTSAGEHLQTRWESLNNFFSNDPFVMSVWVSLFLMMAVYWGVGLLFTIVDDTGAPTFLLRYKVQDLSARAYPISLKRAGDVAAQVLFNQTVVAIPVIIVCYYLKAWKGYNVSTTIPSFLRLVLELILCTLINEVFFYYSHRALHHHLLYKYFHKRHHEWTSPIAISALYCHPVEHVFANVLPTYLGPLILGSHVTTQWIWLILSTPYGVLVHSGFHLPFMPSPEAHDFHHLKFNVNYGIFGIVDRLHGTDALFRKSPAYTRHFVLLGLVPLKWLYPDVVSKDLSGK